MKDGIVFALVIIKMTATVFLSGFTVVVLGFGGLKFINLFKSKELGVALLIITILVVSHTILYLTGFGHNAKSS